MTIPTWPGDMIRQLRTERGWTQKQLRDAAGLGHLNSVYQFETHQSCSIVTFERLLAALGHELDAVPVGDVG